jgi:succinoglycan biosynthesis transport protein ExoP
MELRDYLNVLRRRWMTVAFVSLGALAATAAFTLLMTPQYTAATKLFFGIQGGQSVSDLAQGSTFTENQMSSYAKVATSPLVLDRVRKTLGLDMTTARLAEITTAKPEVDSVVLDIAVTDTNPEQAASIANSIAEQLGVVAVDLVPKLPDGSKAVHVTTLASAVPPDGPSSPRVATNLALGLGLGLLLGVALALLQNLLDTKIRGAGDVHEVTDRAVLGAIPYDANEPEHHVAMRADPLSARSEAVRRLRTNIQFLNVTHRARCILITSSIAREGKTTTAINLAVSLAEAGSRVVLIDADLRRPSIAQYMGLEGGVGLTNVLIGQASSEDVLQPWAGTSLAILPAGAIPPNPSELLGSDVMATLLQTLSADFDILLLDSPPLLAVTDATVLSKFTDSTLLIAGADRTHRQQLRDALDSLTTLDANILGVVLNKISKQERRPDGYSKAVPAWEETGGSSVVDPRQHRRSEEPAEV